MWMIVGAALVVGLLLGMLGGGGSVLTVPLLVYGLELEAKAAIATSLVVVGGTSLIAMIPHAVHGRVRWGTGILFGLAGMAGAFGGGRAAAYIPSGILLLLFAAIMIATAMAMLRGRRQRCELKTLPTGRRKRLPVFQILFDGLLVGALTGLVGAGGGFLVVPALVLLGGLPMHAAIGTSLLVLSMKSAAALAGYITHVAIDWRLAALVTGAAIAGSLVGGVLARRLPATQLRRGFAVFVLLVAVYLVYRELTAELLESMVFEHAEFWLGVLVTLGILLIVRLTQWIHAAEHAPAALAAPHGRIAPGAVAPENHSPRARHEEAGGQPLQKTSRGTTARHY